MSLTTDLRYAFRSLIRRRGTSFVIILTLALCLGATTAVFAVVRAVLIDPWPYQEDHRVVMLTAQMPALDLESWEWSVPEYRDLTSLGVFDLWIAGTRRDVTLTSGDRPERVLAVNISSDLFPMAGVEPLFGRGFNAEEDRPGGPPVVVMNYRTWQRVYGGDPEILDRAIEVEGERYTVVGVMPERFRWWGADMWFPLQLETTGEDRSDRYLSFQGRLAPGVSVEQAQAEMNALSRRLEEEHGGSVDEYAGWQITLNPLKEIVLGDVQSTLLVVFGAVFLVLIIACANLGNLLLSQVLDRNRELAVKMALGAGRGKVIRQLMIEALVLTSIGAALGLLVAYVSLEPIVSLMPLEFVPAESEFIIEGTVLAFAAGVALLTGLLIGSIPVLHVLRGEVLADGLREGGRSVSGQGSGLRNGLTVIEVAVAFVVVIGAALMVQSFLELTSIEPGFSIDDIYMMDLDLPADRYPERFQTIGFYDRLADGLEQIPEVEAAGFALFRPWMRGGYATSAFELDGRSVEEVGGILETDLRVVSRGYFEALDTEVLSGRTFGPQDGFEDTQVAIVNQAMVERFFGGGSVLGQRVRRSGDDRPWRQIVGVVADERMRDLEEDPRPALYLPHSQIGTRHMTLYARTDLESARLVERVQQQVSAIDPQLPVFDVTPMSNSYGQALGSRRLALVLLILFGVIALVLACLGLFAVMAFSVNQRTREIGIRMALGARPGEVFSMVLKRGLMLAGIGVVVGLVAALLATRTLSSLVYGVSLNNPFLFLLMGLLIAALTIAASYLPARRAVRIDPKEALQAE